MCTCLKIFTSTGSRTVAQLSALGYRVKAASRRAVDVPGAESVAFDWYEPATHAAALDGAAARRWEDIGRKENCGVPAHWARQVLR